MDEIYVDASEQVMGRLATKIAKELLNGRRVYVINAEKSLISGNQKFIIKDYKEKVDRGDPYHGPFYPKTSDRIIKRVVRGMLPKKPRGTEALKRLRVYKSKPASLGEKEFKRFEEAKMNRDHTYMELGKLTKRLSMRAK